MDDIAKFLSRLRRQYNAVLTHAGRAELPAAPDPNARCLALAAPAGDDDEYVLRVLGVMDPFWGGCDVPSLIAELDEAKPARLKVLFDSPGGWVAYGFALYSDLTARRRAGMSLTCEARGLVASAAVLPFLAAEKDSRIMGDASMAMVHEVWSCAFACGAADEIESSLTKTVKAMRAMTGTYASVLAKRTGMTDGAARGVMKAETWYTSQEAVDAGLAGAVSEDDEDEDDMDAEARAALVAGARSALLQFKSGLTGVS